MRSSGRSSTLPARIVLSVAVLLLAACSSDDDAGPSSDALDRLVASVAATREAGTARVSQRIVMTFPEGAPADGSAPDMAGGSVEVTAGGYLDLRGRRGRLSVTTEGTGLAGADALGGDMEMILDGKAMYMKSPFYQQLAPDHEPWLRVTFAELGLRGMSQLGQQDPLAFVEALRGVYGEVEDLGEQEVRNAATTHYRATIDVGRLLDELPAAARATVSATFVQLGIEELPIEAWIDAEERVRRMTADVELHGTTTRGGRMEMSLELFDFGVAFDLKPPPPDQVADFGDVFGRVPAGES